MPAEWVRWAVAIFVLLAILTTCSDIPGLLFFDPPLTQPKSQAAFSGSLAVCTALLFLVTMLGAILLVVATQLGLAAPDSSAETSGIAAAAWLAHGGTQVIPSLGIPETLHWAPETAYVDKWSGGVLLVYRSVVVVILFVVVSQIIVFRTRFARRPGVAADTPSADGVVPAAGSFRTHLIAAQEALLTTEAAISSLWDIEADRRSFPSLAESRAVRSDWMAAKSAVERVATEFQRVRELFGTGPIADAAEEALLRLEEWAALVDDASTWPSSRPDLDEMGLARQRSFDSSERFR